MAFLMQRFNIVFDGVWQPHETVAAVVAIVIIAVLILVVICLFKNIVREANPRKSTIFSHRKNKYKSRIGKDNSKYLK